MAGTRNNSAPDSQLGDSELAPRDRWLVTWQRGVNLALARNRVRRFLLPRLQRLPRDRIRRWWTRRGGWPWRVRRRRRPFRGIRHRNDVFRVQDQRSARQRHQRDLCKSTARRTALRRAIFWHYHVNSAGSVCHVGHEKGRCAIVGSTFSAPRRRVSVQGGWATAGPRRRLPW